MEPKGTRPPAVGSPHRRPARSVTHRPARSAVRPAGRSDGGDRTRRSPGRLCEASRSAGAEGGRLVEVAARY
ncbi:hypothetical protein TPA0907_05690 [Micromonospora humidisoli]|nr:hypothetical protein TPA0907_05690 [Micromonospora sp. AKA109]